MRMKYPYFNPSSNTDVKVLKYSGNILASISR